MTTNEPRESAQIFQFPVGGRAGLKPQRELANTPLPGLPDIAAGGSWYHEEAIRNEQPPRTN
jgi:hypothetical protein